jgi:hypothetical protein
LHWTWWIVIALLFVTVLVYLGSQTLAPGDFSTR